MATGHSPYVSPPKTHHEPRTLTDSELEAALTRAAAHRTIFDEGRLEELLTERQRRRNARFTPSA